MARKSMRRLVDEERLKSIGARIRTIRTLKGFTLEEIAQKLGVTKQYLAYVETGFGYMGIPTLLALSDVFGVTPNVLLGYDKRFNEYFTEMKSVKDKYRNMKW